MKKWITESDLCNRWNINKYDLRDIVLHRQLQPFYEDYSRLIIYDGGTAIEHPDGSFTTSPEPATADQVTGCIYLISEVEEYEKRNGIIPNILPTDLLQKGLTENPISTYAQDKIDKVKITPPHPPEPANFFTKTGAYWEVSYKGEKKTIPGLDGIHYIAILLKEPGKSFSCRDLYQAVLRISSDKIVSKGAPIDEGLHADQKKQAVNTPKTKAKYLSRYKELEGDLERINDLMLDERSPEDELEKKEIEDEMAAINSYLKEKNFVDPNDKKAQVNITKRLQSAYKAIGKADMKELVKHLKNHIKPDGAFGLCYTGSITWEITIK